MAEIKNYNWGSSSSIPISGLQYIDGRMVHTKGEYTIKPFGVVPTMLHKIDAEFCIARSQGLHAVVIEENDEFFYDSSKTMDRLSKAPRMEPGETINCPKGSGLALYNSIGFKATVEFQKYYPND